MTSELKIGNRIFPLDRRTYVMGILNVTPDSFSDGGRHNRPEEALKHAGRMIQEGADIIDVGGESTRPGFEAVSEQTELDRVLPVIRLIKQHFDIPVSIDTYKSTVAREAVLAGADMVNDVWGLKRDPAMARTVSELKTPVCIMHNREQSGYRSLMADITDDLKESVDLALSAGISRDSIILDPGIGFGKTYEENLAVLKHMEALREFDLPLLLGVSRKSVVGLTLKLPPEEREEGTLALTVMAVMKGYHFVRVHDVKKNVRVVKMAEAVIYADGEGAVS